MAVINTADDKLEHPQNHGTLGGWRVLRLAKLISIASGDDDGSKFLIAELPAEAILDEITLEVAAITGGSAYDVGIYDVAGTAIDADKFAANLDLSSTTGLPTGPLGAPIRQAMVDLNPDEVNKMLYELAGHVNKTFPASGETLKASKYRIVLTADTIGSVAADIIARVQYRMAV